MIRTATQKDSRAVRHIWKVCFGDSDAYIRFFSRAHLPAGRCLVSRVGLQTAAMLYLLPAVCVYGGQERQVQYVYAAATLPALRRHGLMRDLLEAAHRRAVDQQMLFTCLKPANQPLYRYYGKLGYLPLLHVTHRVVEPGHTPAAFPFSPTEEDALFSLRTAAFSGGVLWGRDLFHFALEEWRMEGGEALAFPGGYCLARRGEREVLCKEVVPGTWSLEQIAAALCLRYDAARVDFRLRWDGAPSSDGGMLRPADPSFDPAAFSAAHPSFSLMLD